MDIQWINNCISTVHLLYFNRITMKLLFTGGHHTSALAVIDSLEQFKIENLKFKITFVGHKYSIHGSGIKSAEYREVTSRGIPFFDLKAGKLYRTWNPLEWARVVFGFFQALWILIKIRPDLIVSFGGYLAAPVVLAGWPLRIPSVTHEQTVVSGWANKLIARFAKEIYISWPQSAKYFPEEKTVLTGLPLRKEIIALARETAGVENDLAHRHSGLDPGSDCGIRQILNFVQNDEHNPIKESPASGFSGCQADKLPNWPAVYITGGKQGSQTINNAVEGCLEKLLEKFQIIHQCGALDKEKFLQIEDGLSEEHKDRYIVSDYFPGDVVARVYRQAHFVVSRAGAHTVYELSALGKPAILIPIPWVSHNEQEKNARLLVDAGVACILSEEDLDPETFLESCTWIADSIDDFRKNADRARNLVTLDAAQKIAYQLLKF